MKCCSVIDKKRLSRAHTSLFLVTSGADVKGTFILFISEENVSVVFDKGNLLNQKLSYGCSVLQNPVSFTCAIESIINFKKTDRVLRFQELTSSVLKIRLWRPPF